MLAYSLHGDVVVRRKDGPFFVGPRHHHNPLAGPELCSATMASPSAGGSSDSKRVLKGRGGARTRDSRVERDPGYDYQKSIIYINIYNIYDYLPAVLLTGFVFCFFPQALHPRSSRNKAGAFVFWAYSMSTSRLTKA